MLVEGYSQNSGPAFMWDKIGKLLSMVRSLEKCLMANVVILCADNRRGEHCMLLLLRCV